MPPILGERVLWRLRSTRVFESSVVLRTRVIGAWIMTHIESVPFFPLEVKNLLCDFSSFGRIITMHTDEKRRPCICEADITL